MILKLSKENKQFKFKMLNVFIGTGMTLSSLCIPVIETIAIADIDRPANETSYSSLNLPYPTASSAMLDGVLVSNSMSTVGAISDMQTSESDIESEEVEDSSSVIEESSDDSSTEETTKPSSDTSSSNNGTNSTESTTKPSESKPSVKPDTKPSDSSNNSSNSSSDSSQSQSSGSSSSKDREKPNAKPNQKNDDKKPKKENQAPIVFSRNQSTAEFIEEIGESAREIGQKNDLYASVMIAQAILESGSGNSGLARKPNYNLFGIKGSYKGNFVEMPTLEDDGSGGMYTISAKFRKYPSYKESLGDYAMLMSGGVSGSSTFYQGAWKSTTKNYGEATRYLTGRYATDTRYHEKLNALIETYDLTQYDEKKSSPKKEKKVKATEEFIKEIAPSVERIADNNDLYASVLIAEAIMKSSSGNHSLMKENNIYQVYGKDKDRNVEMDALKVEKEDISLTKENFKIYDSVDDAIEDHVKIFKQDEKVFEEMTRSKKDSPRKVTAFLTAQNQEDRKYHRRLNGLINTYDLTQYDKPSLASKKKNESKQTAKESKDKQKQTDKSINLVNDLGFNMANKLTESLNQPKKYSISAR